MGCPTQSQSSPEKEDPVAQEVELIQRFNLDSYPADLSPFAPIPNDPTVADIFAKIPSIKYGLKNATGKEYPNPTLELTAKNQDDNDKFTYTTHLGNYIPQLSYPVISIKSKSSKIEQIPLILTLKSDGTEVKKWEITLNSIYALQPTERVENADGTIQYNNISTDIKFEKANDTKRIYFFNSTASPLKIDSANWTLNTNHFQLKYDNQKDEDGYSNCYADASTPNPIPSSSACFIDVEYVGGSSIDTTDTLTVTPKIRDLNDTVNFYKPSTITFEYKTTTGN